MISSCKINVEGATRGLSKKEITDVVMSNPAYHVYNLFDTLI